MTVLLLHAAAFGACIWLARLAEHLCWFYAADVLRILKWGFVGLVATETGLIVFEHQSLGVATRTPAWLYVLMVAVALIFGAISYHSSEWEDEEVQA